MAFLTEKDKTFTTPEEFNRAELAKHKAEDTSRQHKPELYDEPHSALAAV